MPDTLVPDFGLAAEDYATHRQGYPPTFYDRLAAFGLGLRGQKVLDLGTGTGTVARALAVKGCRVTGLDPSSAMLAQARTLADAEGLDIAWVQARAEDTGLPSGDFDLVTASTCWHWFDAQAAAREAKRLLRPGGVLLIASLDWLPLPGNVVDASLSLIHRFGSPAAPDRRGNGIHGTWAEPVLLAGFENLEFFGFDADLVYTHAAWCGRIRASAGVGASLPPEEVARFDAAHAAILSEQYPEDPLRVPHRVFAQIARA